MRPERVHRSDGFNRAVAGTAAAVARVRASVFPALVIAVAVELFGGPAPAPAPPAQPAAARTAPSDEARASRADRPIVWRRSRALGRPDAGRLVAGVRLPASGPHYFTWDPIVKRSPSRPWRRYGTARLVRTLLRVVNAHAAAHPLAPRVTVGDLSRPRGGDFGPRFGGSGHVSHQNGLDADLYLPRLDRRERPPRSVRQVDLRLAQDLVDRFVRAGADKVFVGPNTGLRGPPDVVQPLAGHDDHLHVRLPPAG